MTEHLRVNGVYWGLTALCIMGHQDALPREEMIQYVLECWDDDAGQFPSRFPPPPSSCSFGESEELTMGRRVPCEQTCGTETDWVGTFGAHPGHDGHILGTLSAIQILVIQNALDRANVDRMVACEPSIMSPHSALYEWSAGRIR